MKFHPDNTLYQAAADFFYSLNLKCQTDYVNCDEAEYKVLTSVIDNTFNNTEAAQSQNWLNLYQAMQTMFVNYVHADYG